MDGTAEAAALIGQSGLVKDVTRSLLDDSKSGVLIIGAAGTGKTAVYKAVLRELPPGGSVIRLAATRALAAVPFGALAPYLSELPDSELDSFAAVLKAVSDRLKAEAVRPLFVVDDAQFLDRGTTELLARAVAVGAAEILATSRPGPSIPEQFLALWDDGLLSKFELSPLNRAGVHELCKHVLGADVSPWASAVFAEVTGGNPLMLMSLIEHERYSGALVLRHGVWFLSANPDLAGVPAADVIDQQLRSMTAEERTVAAIVALAGPLPLGQILRFSNPKTVDALEAAGILTVSPGHDRTVRPASPLLGEIIRHRVPAGQSATLRASLLDLPSAGVVGPEAFLNQLRWSLECGAPVPPAQLLQAAAAANTDLNPAAAIQAAEAVRETRFLAEAKMHLAYAHYLLGLPAEAAADLAAVGPVPHGRLSYLAARLAARLPDRMDAAGRERVAEPATGNAGLGPNESPWSQLPAGGLAADILHGQWDGPSAVREARLQDLIDAAGTVPEVRLPAVSALGELRSAQGRLSAGLRLDREAWAGAVSGGLTLPLAQEEVLARHCLSLVRAGEWGELAEVLEGYAADYPSRLLYSGGMLHAMSGFALLRRGRIMESFAELIRAVEELAIADPLEVLPFARAAAGYAAALAGRPGEAREQAKGFHAAAYSGPQSLRLLSAAYCLTVERLTSDGDSAELEALADQAQHQGLRGVETDIRRLLLRSGDTGSATALASSSSAMEGPEGRLLADFARAVASNDAAGLIAISDEATATGHGLLAFEAAQQAAACLEHSPDRWRLTAVQRRLHHLMADAGISGPVPALRNEQGPVLTAREAEILELVATGSTNAHIAAALSLSPRTVEGHLSRIFAKLGVSRRAELLEVKRESRHPADAPEEAPELG
ncbi:DNA-binding CsgD family transcriptional regulator [Arthrobacter sp. B3I9]|uniref:LuxR C-terminal-related transcriptional regulator n=1 Tax=Arthrobacter sp. B3I9 TaxID=3042270 RepID=UPI00278E8588|nr:LuxR C-terminal-related transcriptional regulator [Arthrobacter sp. B3I9]MDQ0851127.1 DNA-binding CsgD family transcriptional regulator [Arthrobacter sp. B3I9]